MTGTKMASAVIKLVIFNKMRKSRNKNVHVLFINTI